MNKKKEEKKLTKDQVKKKLFLISPPIIKNIGVSV